MQTFGRPRLPLSDIIFSATFRTYATVTGRRFVSELRDALAKGYLSKMPSYNSIFDYLKMESLTPYLKHLIAESASPLRPIETAFAVDSSGFSTTRFVRWFDVKYGNNEDWHDWIKMHITCGVTTHVVTGVELSSARTHDGPYFKSLIEQTAKAGFNMKEISADKAYLARAICKVRQTTARRLTSLSSRTGQAKVTSFGKSCFTIAVSGARNF